jgi:SOS-response transcriptional repressor LexA
MEHAAVEEILFIPRQWCPHPNSTFCLRIQGRSMHPVLDDGYVVAVDSYCVDPSCLEERMVAARDPGGAITVKWLRKVGDDYMLMPQDTAPEYPPVRMTGESGWGLMGEVIWWIGRPPK